VWKKSAEKWVLARLHSTTGRRNTAVWAYRSCVSFGQLEEENAQLKKLVADLSLDKQMLQDVLKKSFKALAA